MLESIVSRRAIVEGGIGFTLANFVPGASPSAFAATMEERTVAAGKAAGAADVSGMIWSPYLVPMQPVIAEFKRQTGIGVGAEALPVPATAKVSGTFSRNVAV